MPLIQDPNEVMLAGYIVYCNARVYLEIILHKHKQFTLKTGHNRTIILGYKADWK